LIGPEGIYSVFTMRTLYTLFALISLALVSLVATAAGPPGTLMVGCTLGSSDTICAPGSTPAFTAANLNNHKTYGVVGDDGNGSSFIDVFDSTLIDKLGNYSQLSSDGGLNGTWNFTLWEFRNNLPYKPLDGPYTVDF
jgi:hypothetical protein